VSLYEGDQPIIQVIFAHGFIAWQKTSSIYFMRRDPEQKIFAVPQPKPVPSMPENIYKV
jgi:hypothetical protein